MLVDVCKYFNQTFLKHLIKNSEVMNNFSTKDVKLL